MSLWVAEEAGMDMGEAQHSAVDLDDQLQEPQLGWMWIWRPGVEKGEGLARGIEPGFY